jgi:hypothetical protein
MMNTVLKPFFNYYGSKYSLSRYYPSPAYNSIIEPFAGSAGYSIHYYGRDIWLNDIDPVVYGVWSYLIRSKPNEILKLPCPIIHIDEIGDDVCQEAKHLIGFWLKRGESKPALRSTGWAVSKEYGHGTCGWKIKSRARVARQVRHIKHWRITNKSFDTIGNMRGTWFVDPPYDNKAGKRYAFSAIDYKHLGEWCKERKGQVIVCENVGATWMPFRSFSLQRAVSGRRHLEAIWYSRK